MDELTAILGIGRFKTLLKHLRSHFTSLHAKRLSRPASAVDKDTHHEQCSSVEDEQESLPCDELVAEIEQRVTQLENVLTRYCSRYTHPQKRANDLQVSVSRHCAHVLFNMCQIYDGNGGGSYVIALPTTSAAQNYPQVLITAALVHTTAAPYSHNLLPPCSQYLIVPKLGIMSSWRTTAVVGYTEKVRAAAY
jgi:hypothetical protein